MEDSKRLSITKSSNPTEMAAPPPSSHLLHVLRSHPSASLSSISPSSPSFVSLLRPLFLSPAITNTPPVIPKRLRQIQIPPLRKTIFACTSHISNPLFSQFFSSPAISVPHRHIAAVAVGDSAEEGEDNEVIEQCGEEIGAENDVDEDAPMGLGLGSGSGSISSSSPLERNREERLKLPSLTVKERKELASYAHSLGKKLKSQLVGKSGVTPNLATSFIETLEANELLKVLIP